MHLIPVLSLVFFIFLQIWSFSFKTLNWWDQNQCLPHQNTFHTSASCIQCQRTVAVCRQFAWSRRSATRNSHWRVHVRFGKLDSYWKNIYKISCRTTKCSGVCSKESEQSVQSAKCEPQFVQKRLLALHPSGHKLISELFWFPVTCRCVVVS